MKRKPGRPRSKEPRVTLSVRIESNTRRKLIKTAKSFKISIGHTIDYLASSL